MSIRRSASFVEPGTGHVTVIEEDLGHPDSRAFHPFVGSCRMVFALLGFLGFANVYAMRVNLSLAIVAMVNQTAVTPPDPPNATNICPIYPTPLNITVPSEDGPFIWDDKAQGNLLAAFYWGYVLLQIPGGRISEKFGGKWVFSIGILGTSLLTILTPFAAKFDYSLFMFVRILEGLFEGVTFPSMHAMLAQWATPTERSRMVSYIYAGSQIGTAVSTPITGLLCQTLGWEYVFYIFGSLGLGWFFLWSLFVYDSPSKHPHISEAERTYIQESIGIRNNQFRPKIPWKGILTSAPFWAIVFAHTSSLWGFYTLLSELPTYYRQILHYTTESNGVVSAIPYVFNWLMILFACKMADMLATKDVLSSTQIRKTFNSIGMFGPSLMLLAMCFTGCHSTAAVGFISASLGLSGFASAGYNVNHIDIAPNYAGTLMGITNMCANSMGIITPYFVGFIVDGHEDLSHWRTIFLCSSSIYFLGNVIYLLCGSGEIQAFNDSSGVGRQDRICLLAEESDEDGSQDSEDDDIFFNLFGSVNDV
ncbi:sialin-like [Tigriopus californicus]|uniref:sialin-like n=1 Tax=Tigriopus californicus TaxID=6832 RepID=UPI0027DA33B6|nr:sialin-like [Tigriopus californicus]